MDPIIVALHVVFSLRTDLAGGGRLVAHWEPTLPLRVRLGLALHGSGELSRLGRSGTPTPEIIGRLEGLPEQLWPSRAPG